MLLKLTLGLLFFTAFNSFSSTENERRFIAIFMPEIQRYASQKHIIEALNSAQNPFSLIETLDLDRSWRKNSALRQNIAKHPLSDEFKKRIANQEGNIREILLIDSYGRLIAAYPEPSDYYQGDEVKFIRPTKDRQTFIDNTDWDASSGSAAIQVATPVFDQNNLVGVMVHTVEVNLRILTEMKVE